MKYRAAGQMNGSQGRRPLRDPAPTARRSTLKAQHRLPAFAVGVLVLEAVAFALQLGRSVTPFVLVLIPTVAAVVVSALSGGRAAVGRLARRVGRVRVGARWYLIALGIPVADKLLVDVAGVLLGMTTPDRLLQALTLSALAVPLVVLLPGLLEELGWRGFGVQTAVDEGHSPGWAMAVVGTLFLALHVPLYLPGQLYAGLSFWPLPIILFSYSILLTWVYLRTRSVLVAGLMHAAFNGTVPLTWGLDADWVWAARAIVLIVITTLVVGRIGLTWWRTPLAATEPTGRVERSHYAR
jgi:uncharacterized protein